jgi:hypothetical protein
MAPTRLRRKVTKKTPVRRKKPAVARAKVKASRRAAARRRLAAGKRSTRAVVRKVRAIAAGLVAAGAAAVQTLRSAPPRSPETSGSASEEERIESSKYSPGRAPKRLFETERFIFPESYGVNRVRLLVKDPEWLFAHWDVDPGVLASMRKELGERAVALARLTLRLSDAVDGGSTVILLPKGARAWYIRADDEARSYRAELGLTLPSGEFHPLAASNTVGTPRVGPAPEAARIRVRFQRSGQHVAEASRALAGRRTRAGRMADTRVVGKGRPAPASRGGPAGGASDTYRR